MGEAKIGPSRWWYVLAALFPVIGIAGMAVVMLTGLLTLDEGFQRVVLPGHHELTLTETGSYTIFLEHHTVMDGRVYVTDQRSVSGLELTLISARNRDVIPLEPPGANTTYSVGGRSGVGVLTFDVNLPGLYVLSGRYPAGSEGPDAVFTIGHGFLGKVLVMVFGSLALLFGSGLLCVVTVLVVFLKRRKARKQLEERESPYEMPMSPG